MPKSITHPRKINPATPALLSLLAGWMQQGLESFRVTRDDPSEPPPSGPACASESGKDRDRPREARPTLVTELAMQGTSSFAEAQNILLSLAQRAMKTRVGAGKGSGGRRAEDAAIGDLLHRSLDSFVRTQRDFLNLTSKQTLQWLRELEDRDGPALARLAGLARKGTERFVRAQNQFLDAAARAASQSGGPGPARRKVAGKADLTVLARKAKDAFLTLQEQLLAIAVKENGASLKLPGKTKGIPAKVSPAANQQFSSQGINSLIGAERALMEALTRASEDQNRSKVSQGDIGCSRTREEATGT